MEGWDTQEYRELAESARLFMENLARFNESAQKLLMAVNVLHRRVDALEAIIYRLEGK